MGLSTPELPRPKATGFLLPHPPGPGEAALEVGHTLRGPESLGPREGQGWLDGGRSLEGTALLPGLITACLSVPGHK